MRTSNRIGRVVLAGTLLMSLSLGSFALADQPASAGDTAPVLVEAGAETPLALKTVQSQGIQFQADAAFVEEVDEEGTEGPTFTYLSENGMGEVSILRGDYTSMIGEISADPVAFLGDGMGFESLEITGEHNRTLDDSPLWTLEFTCMVAGQAATGYMTILCSADASAMVTALWAESAGADEVWAFEQLGRSFSLADASQMSGDTSKEGLQVLDGDSAAQKDGDAASLPPQLSMDAAVTFELPNWTLVVSTDPDTFVYTTVSSWDDAANGKGAIGVPVLVTNTGAESKAPWWDFTSYYYGPSGIQQGGASSSSAGWYFDDSFESVASLRPGASANAYIYFYDEGDGEYVAEFSTWDEEYNTVVEEISFAIAR